jgi:hypothetical protein
MFSPGAQGNRNRWISRRLELFFSLRQYLGIDCHDAPGDRHHGGFIMEKRFAQLMLFGFFLLVAYIIIAV